MTRALRGLAVILLGVIAPLCLSAQPITINIPPGTTPRKVPTTAAVTIGGAFSFSPAQPSLTQTVLQANICNPGACFKSSLTVRANQRWQAQVRVKPAAPTTFYVNWITPLPVTQTQVRLSTTWYTIASNSTTTTGAPLALQFNANKVTGNTGVVPTAAALSGYIEFRVIALP